MIPDGEAIKRPTLLCVLDGWGHREEREGNAIELAETPNFDRLWRAGPSRLLRADGSAVGLPDGQFGNSEVGHLHLGAGRVAPQLLPRIDRAAREGAIADLDAFRAFRSAVGSGRVHLLGLLSDGGVHSHRDHLLAIARALVETGARVEAHLITDGRDTAPDSGLEHLRWFLERAPEGCRVASLCGRYWAMDRDSRWDRVERAWAAIALAEAPRASDPLEALEAAYGRGETDEFVAPVVFDPSGPIAEGDGLLCANFRADRVRELLSALLCADFDGFDRSRWVRPGAAVGAASYSPELDREMGVLFPPLELEAMFGEVVAEAGLSQARIAETEKFPHVTYFFNGGRDEPFAGEERFLSPSPKVATYDLAPEMSAREVAASACEALGGGHFDFVLVNFANPDMVGHTGDLDAAVRACIEVDQRLGELERALARSGGAGLVTADHGNADEMIAPGGGPHTAHTSAPVPVIALGTTRPMRRGAASLIDVAPTLLDLMGLVRPEAMTGRSLFDG